MEKYLERLVGMTVTGLVVDKSEFQDGVWGLQFQDGSIAWVLQDPEGNGPGHLDIVGGAI